MEKIDQERNIQIVANNIDIHPTVTMGKNIKIDINGDLSIGKYSYLGSDAIIKGNDIHIGEHFYNSSGLRVGGGGSDYPNANLKVGNRCVFHNNFINVCEPVTIGSDVGLSPDVSIITHGFWWSAFEGHPTKFKGVSIGNKTIVGYRTTILMGVTIGEEVVIGANCVVSKNLESKAIYAGNPIKRIRDITPLNEKKKRILFDEIVERYQDLVQFHNRYPNISNHYPVIRINECQFDLETITMQGTEDEDTDHFRDFIRKYGFRYYTNRPFKSIKKT